MKRTPICYLGLVVCLSSLVVGCGGFEGHSYVESSFTGTFGWRQLDGVDHVQEFNQQAKKWFVERGFVETDDIKFIDIVGPKSGNWDKPGVLLMLSKHNDRKLVYVFIPDFHRPERNIQIIGYHVVLKGTVAEEKGYRDDFHKLDSDFREEFSMRIQPVVFEDSQ